MFVFSNILTGAASVLDWILTIYFWIVIIACLITWVRPDPYNPIVRILRSLTEPLFYRVRKWLPFTYTTGIDFSPVIVLLCIWFIRYVAVRSLMEWGASMAYR